MKQVFFKQPKLLNQVCSSKQPTFFSFKGVSDSPLKIVKHKVSCACTTPIYPEEINGEFELILKIDKSNQSGKFNQSCSLTFSNGQTEIIYVTGSIE